MGITISGPSTQIPTNVVEIGNEISQNAINAIANAQVPSTGNPFTTVSNAYSIGASLVVNKQNTPTASWGYSFPVPTNIPLGVLNGSWVPLAAQGTVLGYDYGASSPLDNSYNFDFTDDLGTFVSLNGTGSVGNSNVTFYYATGNFDGGVSDSTTTVYFQGTGPNYASNWDSPINYAQYYDSNSNVMYRYVYLDGSGGFYTADNQYNPPQ